MEITGTPLGVLVAAAIGIVLGFFVLCVLEARS